MIKDEDSLDNLDKFSYKDDKDIKSYEKENEKQINEENLYNENNKYGNNIHYQYPNPNPIIYTENNINNYNYVYNQEDQTITPIITIKDLQDNPKQKLLINSPYSLKALYDSGYTLEELYYKTFDEFVDEHKDIIHINDEAKINRFNFYEQLRLDKISNLVKYREKLIKDGQKFEQEYGQEQDQEKIKELTDNNDKKQKES